ncbi:hypothetical protein B0H11DRAFT_1965919, partial [Mycena galericulata]
CRQRLFYRVDSFGAFWQHPAAGAPFDLVAPSLIPGHMNPPPPPAPLTAARLWGAVPVLAYHSALSLRSPPMACCPRPDRWARVPAFRSLDIYWLPLSALPILALRSCEPSMIIFTPPYLQLPTCPIHIFHLQFLFLQLRYHSLFTLLSTIKF